MFKENRSSKHRPLRISFICGAILIVIISILLSIKYTKYPHAASSVVSDACFIAGVVYLILFIIMQVSGNALFGFHSYLLYKLTALRTHSNVKYKSYAAYTKARNKEKPVSRGLGNLSYGAGIDEKDNHSRKEISEMEDYDREEAPNRLVSPTIFWLPGLVYLLLSIILAFIK